MTPGVLTVSHAAPVRDVAALLSARGISGAPVVNDRGRVVGVVSEGDLVRSALGRTRRGLLRVVRDLRHLGARGVRIGRGTAAGAMSAPAVTVAPDVSVAAAAALMLERKVARLPVVDGGRLVGIVTRADLVRAFTRDDDRILREIWADVVLRGVHVSPRTLTVDVSAGAVTIAGEVETRGKAERLVEYVRRVPGVVSVRSETTWRLNDDAPRGVPPPRAR